MNQTTFCASVLDAIEGTVPGFNRRRCETSYDDFLRVDLLATAIEAGRPTVSWWDAAEAGDHEPMAYYQHVHPYLPMLLKAQYFFAALAIDSLLAATCNQPDLTMQRFLKARGHAPLYRLSLAEALRAYTVCIFRHKFVAHPELSRLMAYKADGSGTARVVPSRLDGTPTFPPDSVDKLAALSHTYGAQIPGLAGNRNPYEQVSLLFYGVPLGTLGSPNPDRRAVDALAEHTLCESLSRTELVEAVDTFAWAIVAALG